MQDPSTDATPRLEPLEPERWPSVGTAISSQLPSHLNVYRTMAHNGPLLAAWAPLRKCLVADTPLTQRQLELLTLRVARNTETQYEWQHHLRRGAAAGLTPGDIERVRVESPDDFVEEERALMRAADELHARSGVSSSTWRALEQSFDHAQILAILATVGFYVTLSYLLNSCGVQMERAEGR